ncbi:serine hydrolase [Terracoccus luteus]|nr:serine hydrolase [Terracoccus luteus]
MPPSSRAPLAALDARLDAVVGQDGSPASISAWWGGLDGEQWWSRRDDVPHYAASTMKLPLVIAAQRLVVAGRLRPDEAVAVDDRFASVADGSVFAMDEDDDQDPDTWAALGGTRTLAQLMEHAVIHSGNLATNLLLGRVGLPAVADVLADAGCSSGTVVGRGIEDAVARRAGITNTVTAADLARLLTLVARRDPALGGPEVCEPIEAVLARQTHVDQIPAGLPAGTPTASKSGWIPGVSHDACTIRPDAASGREPFVLVVCTTVDLPMDQAARLVASVAADVWAAG